ncbi:MAG: hypothetical protein AAF235_08455, partial [Planctomycetota bacterium]
RHDLTRGGRLAASVGLAVTREWRRMNTPPLPPGSAVRLDGRAPSLSFLAWVTPPAWLVDWACRPGDAAEPEDAGRPENTGRELLRVRYGLAGYPPRTLESLARVLGKTVMQTAREERSAIRTAYAAWAAAES